MTYDDYKRKLGECHSNLHEDCDDEWVFDLAWVHVSAGEPYRSANADAEMDLCPTCASKWVMALVESFMSDGSFTWRLNPREALGDEYD